jgi:hypothetical protein
VSGKRVGVEGMPRQEQLDQQQQQLQEIEARIDKERQYQQQVWACVTDVCLWVREEGPLSACGYGGAEGGRARQEQLDQQQQQLQEVNARIDKERQYQQQVWHACVHVC